MAEDSATENAVRIERTFDAPPEFIWRMWTEPDHFRAWYGPVGASIVVAEFDVRVGGTRRVCMEIATPNGTMQMWFTGEHREIIANRRLVYTESMSNEDGDIVSPSDAGMTSGHPTTTEITVELESVGRGTKMVMTHAGIPQDSPGAAGWTMAFDKLAEHVTTQRPR